MRSIKQLPVPRTIALCGGSSTGKTSRFIRICQEALPGLKVVVHQDPFRYLTQGQSFPFAADDPQAYKTEFGVEVIRAFKRRRPITIPIWHIHIHPDQAYRIPAECSILPTENLLFEGIYTAYGPLSGKADVTIYTQAPAWSRYLRRILRNWLERKRATPELVSKGFLNYVLPAHKLYVRKQLTTSDFIWEIPYQFEDSIALFQLTPIDSQIPISSTIYHINLQAETSFIIAMNRSKKKVVQVLHNRNLYLEFPISEEEAKQFREVDWLAY